MNINKYIGTKIREFREKRNLTQEEIAEYLKTTAQTISRYEIGDRKTNQDILFKLAEYFKVSINDFFPPLSFDNATYVDISSDIVHIPVLGKIPAGMPLEAIEEQYAIDTIDIPKEWLRGSNKYFALKLEGDSMEPDYLDKDIVIFKQASDCESGQDCCIRINGFDATFKRIRKQENGIMVIPLNENNSTGFVSTFYSKEEIISKPVEILGVVKQIRIKNRRRDKNGISCLSCIYSNSFSYCSK